MTTPSSVDPPILRTKILNVVRGVHDERDHFTAAVRTASSRTPTAVLRVDLRGDMPAVYDQGTIGSCTANAACAIHTYNQKRFKETPSPILLSRLFEYYASRTDKSRDTGATLKDAVMALASLGACRESLWAYDVKKFTAQPPHNCYVDATTYRIAQYARVPQSPQSFEAVLSAGMPILIGIAVYESFGRVGSSGRVAVPNPRGERLLGGHALVVVGFDRTDTARPVFIVRNSWGVSWGDRGDCYIPYSYLMDRGLCFDPWTFVNRASTAMPSSAAFRIQLVNPRDLFLGVVEEEETA